ncbi:MAG TPA: hypothetical protein PLJ44_03880 [Victivallales bacterium]|nr:hypothetical protein [Victivallales bacterium]
MIEEIIKIHDKYQFEIKFSYEPEENCRKTKYTSEIYIFIPKSIGLSRENYTKTQFYEDVKSYIRLKTPLILLRNLYGKNSPLQELERSIERLVESQNERNSSDFEYRIKMFCSILKSSLRDELIFLKNNINMKDIEKNISDFLENLKDLSREFRKLSKKIKVASMNQKYINLYNFADEYLSIISNESRHELFELLEKNDIKKRNSLIEELTEQAKEEIIYRKESNYPSIPSEEHDNEEIIFRKSALKKLMGRILFLHNITKSEGKLIEQLLFGLSAGIAMAFATSIAFMSRTRLGEFSLFFFLLMVIAYIFKDRMKEIMKIYFSNLVRKFFADKRTKIYTNLGQKIGIIRESFSIFSDEKISPEISKIRDRDFISGVHEGAYGEYVLFYRKDITLYSEKFKTVFPGFQINGINDITRVNIFRFLRNMDNPYKDVFIPKKNSYVRVSGSRVYHFNIIIKSIISTGKSKIQRIRLVLTREGIKRIEEVFSLKN